MLYFQRWKVLLITGSCLFFVLMAIPSLLSDELRKKLPVSLSQYTVNLGLDLQGGSQLLLEIDFNAYMREQLTNLVDEIRLKLREQKIGYRNLSASDGKVIFSLREETADIEKTLLEISPDLEISKTGEGYEIQFSEKW